MNLLYRTVLVCVFVKINSLSLHACSSPHTVDSFMLRSNSPCLQVTRGNFGLLSPHLSSAACFSRRLPAWWTSINRCCFPVSCSRGETDWLPGVPLQLCSQGIIRKRIKCRDLHSCLLKFLSFSLGTTENPHKMISRNWTNPEEVQKVIHNVNFGLVLILNATFSFVTHETIKD